MCVIIWVCLTIFYGVNIRLNFHHVILAFLTALFVFPDCVFINKYYLCIFLALLFINFDGRVPLSALIPYSVKFVHHRFIERTSSKDRIPRIRQERNVCSFGREYIMCHTSWYFPKDGASRRRCSVLWLGGGGWEIVAFFNRSPMYCQNKISKRNELMVSHSLFVNCISSFLTTLSHLNQTTNPSATA